MIISVAEATEAERLCKAERMAAGRWLKVDESRVRSPKDMMLVHRVRAVAAEQSAAFDEMLRDRDVNRLFNDGVFYFEPP